LVVQKGEKTEIWQNLPIWDSKKEECWCDRSLIDESGETPCSKEGNLRSGRLSNQRNGGRRRTPSWSGSQKEINCEKVGNTHPEKKWGLQGRRSDEGENSIREKICVREAWQRIKGGNESGRRIKKRIKLGGMREHWTQRDPEGPRVRKILH